MASYSIAASEVSQCFPEIKKGKVKIFTSEAIFYEIGDNPVAKAGTSAVLRQGITEINLQNNSKIAILQVSVPGTVTITEATKSSASCSK